MVTRKASCFTVRFKYAVRKSEVSNTGVSVIPGWLQYEVVRDTRLFVTPEFLYFRAFRYTRVSTVIPGFL